MSDYKHIHHLKIDELDEVQEEQLDEYSPGRVGGVSMYWPEELPQPNVGWVLGLKSESELFKLINDIDDEETETGIDALEEFIEKETRRQRGTALTHDPAKRAKLARENLKTTLDWLRLEPYSTVEVMSLVLGKSVPGTRRILNKFADDGWLVRDEIKWVGSTRKVHLFGVSAKGLYHLLDDGAIEPPPTRDFERGKTVVSRAGHILNTQLARLYYQRKDNPKNVFRQYRAARDLPFHNDRSVDQVIHRWWTYPDALIDNSHMVNSSGQAKTIAIEIEQMTKGSRRYKNLIKLHRMNMKKGDRYDHLIYMLGDADERDARKKLFHRLIDGMHPSDEAAVVKQQFSFDTYDDLAERIRALG